MPAAPDIVRRFEVQPGEPGELGRLERILREAVEAEAQALSVLTLNRVDASSLIAVRLRGAPGAAARVVERVAAAGGAIRHDLVDVPIEEQRPGVYPEAQPLLSMQASTATGAASRAEPPRGEVIVAIVDSGLHVEHEVLRGHLWTGEGGRHGGRFIGDDIDPNNVDPDIADEDGHGTSLAGTILAVAGSAPRVQLMGVKFFDPVTRPSAINAARAIDFAVANGARIIDLSWDIGLESEELEGAIHRALEADRLVVFAAGNGGSNNDTLTSIPSLYAAKRPDHALTVMAVTRYGEKAWFSNYGDAQVNLGAPGVGILSTSPYLSEHAAAPGGERRRVRRYSGTSAASAYVTGAAALIMASHPGLEVPEVRECLLKSVWTSPELRCASKGRLNVRAAMESAAAMAAAGPTSATTAASAASR